MFKFSERSKMRMQGVDQRLVEVFEKAIQVTPIDFGIPQYGGFRTARQQRMLFEAGKSKADGYEKKSKHQEGKALDVYAYVDGKASWDERHLSLIACAILQSASLLGYKVKWGGLWRSFKDMPHFQIED